VYGVLTSEVAMTVSASTLKITAITHAFSNQTCCLAFSDEMVD